MSDKQERLQKAKHMYAKNSEIVNPRKNGP